MNRVFFNAHHSPMGSFSSFTLGYPGAKGGFGLELGKPADQNIFIGLQNPEHDTYKAFPFFDKLHDESSQFDVEKEGKTDHEEIIEKFTEREIARDYQLTSDTWMAGDLKFTLYSPVRGIPDPDNSSPECIKKAILPAVFAQISVDNTKCSRKRRIFIGFDVDEDGYRPRRLDEAGEGLTGIGRGRQYAIVTDDPRVTSARDFSMEKLLTNEIEENWRFCLGTPAALLMDVPAGETATYRFAICFFKDGLVTTGINCSYYYTRYFKSLEEVGRYAMAHWEELVNRCIDASSLVSNLKLSDDQKFMMIHAIRSYYGSTQLLENEGKPLWVVNEGEYRMINTFDLTVDHLFFEIKMNPWVVKNVLEVFVERYSYMDKAVYPGDTKEYLGGISFTHDMGVTNHFTRKGFSSYERHGLSGCFSHMTHEQLVNWVCCASVYVEQTGDKKWLTQYLPVFIDCLHSMINRDHADESQRDGIMSMDSSRTMGGVEITTYDSLDSSLGQARNNIYLAGKCWAAYIALEKIFLDEGLPEPASLAGLQAERCARTLTRNLSEEGFIPAILENGNNSRIIPAIEGLVFPYFTNCRRALDAEGRFGQYIQALKTHLHTVLKKGVCLFEDGGWKLSSTSNNSWLSKIYLCQFIARKLLGLKWDEQGEEADRAHVSWLLHPQQSYYAWSDQMISGVAVGSKYYPRGVTSILWLLE